jgi:hypothetical protein
MSANLSPIPSVKPALSKLWNSGLEAFALYGQLRGRFVQICAEPSETLRLPLLNAIAERG